MQQQRRAQDWVPPGSPLVATLKAAPHLSSATQSPQQLQEKLPSVVRSALRGLANISSSC